MFVLSNPLSPKDAIKKILLEPERGKLAKYGANQNKKLRREVTTISRMTHKNIVRYYQAWVEGGPNDEIKDDTIKEEEDDENIEAKTDREVPSTSEGQQNQEVDDDDDDDDDQGGSWWVNSPDTRGDIPIHQARNDDQSSSSSGELGSSSTSTSWSDAGDDCIDSNDPFGTSNNSEAARDIKHSASVVDLLEHENDFGLHVRQYLEFRNWLQSRFGCGRSYKFGSLFYFDISFSFSYSPQNPLLNGLGFQDTATAGLYDGTKATKTSSLCSSEKELLWDDDSSVKVSASPGRSILYIQVGFGYFVNFRGHLNSMHHIR